MAAPGTGNSDFVGRIAVFMALKLFVGTILGFLTGLGVGGGSLLILWLSIAMEMDPSTARGINLLFFLPSALIACCFRWKQGSLEIKSILPAIISGTVSAALFSWIGINTNTDWIKKGFGFLLILTGIRELIYKPKRN